MLYYCHCLVECLLVSAKILQRKPTQRQQQHYKLQNNKLSQSHRNTIPTIARQQPSRQTTTFRFFPFLFNLLLFSSFCYFFLCNHKITLSFYIKSYAIQHMLIHPFPTSIFLSLPIHFFLPSHCLPLTAAAAGSIQDEDGDLCFGTPSSPSPSFTSLAARMA